MSLLSDISFKPTYYRGQHDIANEFYLPCVSSSIKYDRAVGFYSSAVYLIAWGSLKEFVANGGKMRFITSPRLTNKDKNAVIEGYKARNEQDLFQQLDNEFKKLLNNEQLYKPAKALAYLIANEILEFKIAIPDKASVRTKRMFHDKEGLFKDYDHNRVLFRGSMNETFYGLSQDGNIDSVDVFVSWDEREKHRVDEGEDHFNRLWNNIQPGVDVIHMPNKFLEKIKTVSRENAEEFSDIVDDINYDIDKINEVTPSGYTLRSHQSKALDNWKKNNRCGIFKHATGSGKTFTALCAIREAIEENNEVPLILVPGSLLLEQWRLEINKFLGDIDPVICLCGDGNNGWKRDNLLRLFSENRNDNKPRIILSTIRTAITDRFMNSLKWGEHIFCVVDEVHRIGSNENSKFMDQAICGPRLGLSATPERYGDEKGTKAILDFFKEIIKPVYTIKDAIDDKILTPYFYYPHIVELNEDEQEEWDDYTKSIRKYFAQIYGGSSKEDSLRELVKMKLIERSRISKNANNKINMASQVLDNHYKDGDVWLVYCDNTDQMNELRRNIEELNLLNGVPIVDYYYKMEGDKKKTIEFFKKNSGVILSIKCLDEGFNIPSATHALILASSKNPREFIQRRGRVLRRNKNKGKAEIHDVLVVPNYSMVDPNNIDSILKGEVARTYEFSSWSENSNVTRVQLKDIAIKLGLSMEDLISYVEEGFEDD